VAPHLRLAKARSSRSGRCSRLTASDSARTNQLVHRGVRLLTRSRARRRRQSRRLTHHLLARRSAFTKTMSISPRARWFESRKRKAALTGDAASAASHDPPAAVRARTRLLSVGWRGR
jgi:hypothetical protein